MVHVRVALVERDGDSAPNDPDYRRAESLNTYVQRSPTSNWMIMKMANYEVLKCFILHLESDTRG